MSNNSNNFHSDIDYAPHQDLGRWIYGVSRNALLRAMDTDVCPCCIAAEAFGQRLTLVVSELMKANGGDTEATMYELQELFEFHRTAAAVAENLLDITADHLLEEEEEAE